MYIHEVPLRSQDLNNQNPKGAPATPSRSRVTLLLRFFFCRRKHQISVVQKLPKLARSLKVPHCSPSSRLDRAELDRPHEHLLT